MDIIESPVTTTPQQDYNKKNQSERKLSAMMHSCTQRGLGRVVCAKTCIELLIDDKSFALEASSVRASQSALYMTHVPGTGAYYTWHSYHTCTRFTRVSKIVFQALNSIPDAWYFKR